MSSSDQGRIARNLEALNANLLARLECPVCSELCTPPIHVCANGHPTCAGCRLRVAQCSLCRAPDAGRRDRLAEELFPDAVALCRYVGVGCKRRFNVKDGRRHAANCRYRFGCRVRKFDRATCATSCCAWRGRRSDLSAHVRDDHPEAYATAPGAVAVCRPFDAGVARHSTLLDLDGALFWWTLDRGGRGEEGAWRVYARHVGPKRRAALYKCETRLSSPDGTLKREFSTPVLRLDEKIVAGNKNARLSADAMGSLVDPDRMLVCRVDVVRVLPASSK